MVNVFALVQEYLHVANVFVIVPVGVMVSMFVTMKKKASYIP